MRLPRWVPVVALVSSMAFLGGCAVAGGSSPSNSGSGLAIMTSALPAATVSQSYAGSLQAAGGTKPYSWSVTSGALPTGLTLTTAGQISGTPTQLGSYSFQTQVTDATKQSTSANFSMQVTGPTPSISGISPQYGSTSGGTTVTISGNNLQSGATVTFGGIDATSSNVASSSQMTAVTPAHAAGSVDVVVTNVNGKSATLPAGFGYGNAAPSLLGIGPSNGPTTGGTAVTITGANFVFGAIVLFAGVQASSTAVMSPTQIQAVSPAGTAGTADVSVQNPDGQKATLAGAFTYGTADPPQDLLSGCTVGPSNQPSCPTPTGWTLAQAEGFDTGALANTSVESLAHGAKIECTVFHSGSCAMTSVYASSENEGFWNLAQNAIGSTSHEVYVSWWQKDTSSETSGNNNYVIRFIGATGDGGSSGRPTRLDVDDWLTGQGSPACLNGVSPSGGSPGSDTGFGGYLCQNSTYLLETFFADGSPATVHYGQTLPFPTSWSQFEVHYKANTSSGSTPSTNGDIEIYKNGKEIFSASGNLNKLSTMNGMSISLGTYFETADYYTSSAYTACAAYHSTSYKKVLSPSFSVGAPCPYPTTFTKYWDDIIVLKK